MARKYISIVNWPMARKAEKKKKKKKTSHPPGRSWVPGTNFQVFTKIIVNKLQPDGC